MKINSKNAFILFATLIAVRDAGAEQLLKLTDVNAKILFAFIMCTTITVISFLIILFQGGFRNLYVKINHQRSFLKIIVIGISAGIIYIVTFQMIGRFGAGAFDLFDYGTAPVLTIFLGVVFFKNRISWRSVPIFCFYIIGLYLIFKDNQEITLFWILVGLASPISTAISDATSKSLLSSEKYSLTASELLFLRFFQAMILIGLFIVWREDKIYFNEIGKSIVISIFGGFVPLWLLCTALAGTSLARFAVWEFLIPLMALIFTIPFHPENLSIRIIGGAVFIALAIILNEIKMPTLNNQ